MIDNMALVSFTVTKIGFYFYPLKLFGMNLKSNLILKLLPLKKLLNFLRSL